MEQATWVVRTKKGKFVRAFMHEDQAKRWEDSNPNWTYSREEPHAPDSEGMIYDAVKP